MNQQLKQEIHGILQRNAGNRLSEDLIMGISVRMLTLIEKELFELGQETQALNTRIKELEDQTTDEGEVNGE